MTISLDLQTLLGLLAYVPKFMLEVAESLKVKLLHLVYSVIYMFTYNIACIYTAFTRIGYLCSIDVSQVCGGERYDHSSNC